MCADLILREHTRSGSEVDLIRGTGGFHVKWKIYEQSGTGYERLISYTSGSKRDTSGYKVL
ncbi:hypothetical protein NCCP2222_38230 [Sporosarcina sp. NCCP-2222]|nr:hypothetical protein NCCP2222_38230 [Sporosarcina sp. NCCP-2222]